MHLNAPKSMPSTRAGMQDNVTDRRWPSVARWAVGAVLLAISVCVHTAPVLAQETNPPTITVVKADDFEVTGRGDHKAWSASQWVPLTRRSGGSLDYTTRVKMLYSDTGVYVLFDGEDAEVSASAENQDFDDLWLEDVYEVFFWTDDRHPVYFEYEISPFGRELPILIPNFDGKFLGWRPWHYEGPRRTRKAVHLRGGDAARGAAIEGWSAEVFIPYELLRPLQNVPPQPGSTWRANFYRVDYDGDRSTGWHWAPVGSSFHEYKKFGTLKFQ